MQDIQGSQVALAGRIVMVAMNREDGNGDVDVRIFVVDMVEGTVMVSI